MAWRLAKSLKKLQEQINEMAPGRSKVSDGTIGDAAHSARKSDHNPNEQGIVAAIRCHTRPFGRMRRSNLEPEPDRRFAREVCDLLTLRSGKLGQVNGRSYDGKNPHDHHVHVSVKPDALDQTQEWAVRIAGAPGEVPPATPTLTETRPLLKTGASGEAVRALQQLLTHLAFPAGWTEGLARTQDLRLNAFKKRAASAWTGKLARTPGVPLADKSGGQQTKNRDNGAPASIRTHAQAAQESVQGRQVIGVPFQAPLLSLVASI